jgi:transposase-like protein
MVNVPVQCPYCQSVEVIKAGKQSNGAQRYQCQNGQCPRRIFLLQYQDRGRVPEIRCQVVDMALNGSGIRDTARVLRISPTTVIAILKKPRCCNTSTPRCYLLHHAPAPSASDQNAPPKWMKCGVSSGPKRRHGGCGTCLIITRGEYLRMSLVPGRMQHY